jgi:riboflavin biosynthesis pyrimidine reductase
VNGGPPLQVLWPAARAGEVLAPDEAEEALAALYAYPLGDHGAGPPRWLRANMVSTLDGAAAGADGRSGSINSEADFRVFVVLRSLAAVVLAGAGTVRAERYGAPKARAAFAARRAAAGQPPTPTLAIVTRSGRVPTDQGLFDGDRPALVVTCEAEGAPVLDQLRGLAGPDGVLVAGREDVDIPRALDMLAERGLRRMLCEGGPSLLGTLVRAGALNELCLTWSPVLAGGDAGRILRGARVDAAMRPVHLLHAEGTLLGRWLAQPSKGVP